MYRAALAISTAMIRTSYSYERMANLQKETERMEKLVHEIDEKLGLRENDKQDGATR